MDIFRRLFPFPLGNKNLIRSILLSTIFCIYLSIGSVRNYPPVASIFSGGFIVVLTLWWIWRIKFQKGLARSPLSLPLIILLNITILSFFFSEDLRISFEGVLATTFYILFFFLLCDLFLSGWDIEIFEVTLILSTSYLIIIATTEIISWYFEWYQVYVPEYPIFPLRYRLFSPVAHPNLFVVIIYITIPFVVFRLRAAQITINRFLWIIWLLFAGIVIYYLNSRGGIIATFGILTIVMVWILRKNRFLPDITKDWLWNNRNVSKLLAFYILFFILLVFVNNLVPSIPSLNLRHGSDFSSGRIGIWKVGFEMISKNPILGTGPHTFAQNYYNDFPKGLNSWIASHAHNLFINFGAELGLIGLIGICWIVLAIPWYLYKNNLLSLDIISKDSNLERIQISSIAIFVGVLLHSAVDVPISVPQTILPIIVFLVVGLKSFNLLNRGEKISRLFLYIALPIIPLVVFVQYKLDIAHISQLQSLITHQEEEWKETIDLLEVSARQDPSFEFYNGQRGYAYGDLQDQHPSVGTTESDIDAINILSETIESELIWIPNNINLADLYIKSGELTKAIQALEYIPNNWYELWPQASLFLTDCYIKNGENEKAMLLMQFALKNQPWIKDTLICQINSWCSDYVAEVSEDIEEIYDSHNQVKNLIKSNNAEQAFQILDKFNLLETPTILWIDRAYVHVELREYKQAKYALMIAENSDANRRPETKSYFTFVKSNLMVSQNMKQEAIKLLESYTRPIVFPKFYENELHGRFGFPLPFIKHVSILFMDEYELKIYYQLLELYEGQENKDGQIWVKNQIEQIEEVLNNNLKN